MISSDVPGFEHAAALLHLDAVDEGRADQPGHQRHVLDRVPAPVAAPAQHVVGPPGAEDVAETEDDPGDHRVAARRGRSTRCRACRWPGRRWRRRTARSSHQARQQHRRVDAHARVVQQRVQADAVRGRPRQRLEWRGDEAEQQRHEAFDGHQHRDDVRHEHAVRARLALLPQDDRRKRSTASRPSRAASPAGRCRTRPGPGPSTWPGWSAPRRSAARSRGRPARPAASPTRR